MAKKAAKKSKSENLEKEIKAKPAKSNGTTALGFEETLWQAADKQRGHGHEKTSCSEVPMLLTELRIKNFRGIKELNINFSSENLLVGENNTGKSTILAAIRYALEHGRGRRTSFEEFDYHLTTTANDPHAAPPISIELLFIESPDAEWPEELVQALNDVAVYDDNDIRKIWLRVCSQWDQTLDNFSTKTEFLDKDGNPLQGKGNSPFNLTNLQRLRPVFYLSALREAGREFTKQSQYWGSFLRGSTIDPNVKIQLENELSEINAKVIQAHQPFEEIRTQLARLQQLVPTSNLADVSVEAVPGRLFDMLSKTQVSISSGTGAKVPISKHGEGTQSLSVLLLFDAFLKSRLAHAYEKNTSPIVAIEEPEAHLHPCAVRSLWKTICSLSGQKIISSHSGDLIAEVPISSVQRLYKKGGETKIGFLKKDTLNPTQTRMFNHHIRTTRGELLFANCWLLCEGESEILLLRNCAELLGADLPRWGVRLVEYRNMDLGLCMKVAEDFGIGWHCFADNDQQGQADQNKVKNQLNGRNVDNHLSVMPEANLEEYLSSNGFFSVYENELTPQIKNNLSTTPSHCDYKKDVIKCVTSARKKPDLIENVCRQIETNGVDAIPALVSNSIRKAVSIAGGTI